MRTRLSAMFVSITSLGLAPIAASADTCGTYPLTQAQSDYLQAQQLEIAVPEGTVPVVQRCDVDGNNIIDRRDLDIIRAHRGEAPPHPDDPMDWDGDGVIHGRDVGGCASSCNSTGCSVKTVEEEEGMAAAQQTGGVLEPAACYQTGDFDGDGAQDLFGIYAYTGSGLRVDNWSLQIVILTEDQFGNVQHITYPYTGRESNGQLAHHLSRQLPGTINLNPGTVTISGPGVVSYRDGEPKVIFYYANGQLAQAFYGIDD